jgi:hypothetical protein
MVVRSSPSTERILERAAGFEPASLAWKARAQPLYQARVARGAATANAARFMVTSKDVDAWVKRGHDGEACGRAGVGETGALIRRCVAAG